MPSDENLTACIQRMQFTGLGVPNKHFATQNKQLYEELISYADLHDHATFEAKKMIVNQIIRRVDVYRGYQVEISFNFDLAPYITGK